MPHYLFVPFNDVEAVEKVISDDAAAVILEPVQGEGGIIVPSETYLEELSEVCRKNDTYLILDEIQTGFFRTGPAFASSPYSLKVDFMTMAKGIAGGFPFSAFAISEEVSSKLEAGDHGGTYCGNPLGCAVAHAVIQHMIETDISRNVQDVSSHAFTIMFKWKEKFPLIQEIRGKGLLMAIELSDAEATEILQQKCMQKGLLLNTTKGNIIRIFPALNITKEEISKGLEILHEVLTEITGARG
jgi:acetylornithine/N-succinyldiaminopimelate aminotransferase